MKLLKQVKLFVASVALGSAALFTGVMATSQPTYAAGCSSSFLTFPAWYRGLTNADCSLMSPDSSGSGSGISLQNYVWVIVLNVIELALQLVAYLTVFMIIYGGFLFMTNGGESSKIVTARKTIITALIGLGVSSVAIGATNLIFGLIAP